MASDDAYELETPEQIELTFDVAGLGSRSIAALVDTLVQGIVLLALLVAGAFVAGFAGGFTRAISFRYSVGSTTEAVVLAVVVVVAFIVVWGYYIFFEMAWNGQTPGKRAANIRVLTTRGQPITLAQALIRNLVRIVDFLPGSYMLGSVVILLNRRSQRLGDLAAGTIVVKERRQEAPLSLRLSSPVSGLPPHVVSSLKAEDVSLARSFLL